MLFRFLLAALALSTAATAATAGPFRRRAQTAYQPAYQPVYQSPAASPYQSSNFSPSVTPTGGYVIDSTPVVLSGDGSATSYYTPSVTTAGYPAVATGYASGYTTAGYDLSGSSVGDGLDEVNAKRAARGLRPFVRDEGLTQAARACAAFRASRFLFGHTGNDFAFVPAGTSASSAGCAAYPASYGWMSCCTYDNYTYAGAAWVTGSDGKRYMHLYVR